ncbi:Geranylgeranyl reductase family [Propionibacterium ruminifibrarum]|jgi:geranylgeranyl reductase family protein|uniref:Geranylgeranyl reductase family n=1 Tax=Propionibacterium ruminifibrarum TaxID=1962131 RepID=A0A375I2E2_9ACTN|nr:Geranylgeranyl reductase family [Propionibacterium ruminifibrarum]
MRIHDGLGEAMTHSEVPGVSNALASGLLADSAPVDQDEADVIVVGAGPGGSATAAFCAQRGLDVLLLEKATFPRDKVCGDGLTPRAVRMLTRLGIDTSESAGFLHNKGLRVYGGRTEPFELPWPELADFPNYGTTCPRLRLDDMLAGRAMQLGVHLLTGANVVEPLLVGDRITGVRTADGRTFRAPVVVAADGNSTRLGVAMGRRRDEKRPMGVAVRAYFESPRHDDPWMESWLELWDGERGHSTQLPGYAWVFPMGDGRCNVGLGMLNSSPAFGRTDYRRLMRTWLASTPPQWCFDEEHMVDRIRGAALPMALNRKPAYAGGLLLVGDAGGMVNPFNGEGIDYSLEAAEMAADAICEAHSRGIGTAAAERALMGYETSVQKGFGGYYRLGMIFSRLIGNPKIMHLCTTYGLPRPVLMRFVNKLLANLTDARGGDAFDHIINTLTRIAPSA